MKRTLMHFFLGTAWGLVYLSASARAQPPTMSYGFPSDAHCHHVIQQILRHGVNNRFDRTQASRLLHPVPSCATVAPAGDVGDLQIAGIRQLPPEGPSEGPRFSITINNQSSRKLSRFHVSLVAVLGSIHPHSPCSTVPVDNLSEGESRAVTVKLPIAALSMGNRNGEILSYQTLVVAIDSFDELLESDEANNVRAISPAEIPMVDAGGESPAPTEAPGMIRAASPSIPPVLKNEGEVSVDALDLEYPTPDSLRSAIEQFRIPQEPTGV